MRDSPQGLTSLEAQARLEAEGANELPRTGSRSVLRIVRDVVREPMFGLLIGAGVIYLLLGDLTEALMLLGFASISVVIAVVQESRSERVLEALRDLTSPRARWSSATASGGGSPAAKWCAAISSSSARAIARPRTRCWSRPAIYKPTNRC